MAQNSEMKFQIRGVEIINLELVQLAEILPNEVVFNFDISIEHKINSENKFILVLVGVNITHNNKETLLGKIIVSCVYAIENFEEVVQESKPQSFTITDAIIDILNSISISTTRGVMASTFKGTFLHNAVLPIVNPKDFQKQKLPME